jgi:hypothetical protein
MKHQYITGSVCTSMPNFKPQAPPTEDLATTRAIDEGERLLELTKQLHQRVYTTEQRINMLSNLVQVQQLKLHLLAR